MASVFLPATQRRLPAAVYLAGLRRAKAEPDQMFKHGLRGWWPVTGREVVAEYRDDLHRRINHRARVARPECRVHPFVWWKASTPRVVLEPSDLRQMNRHQKRRLATRLRDE
jgi:hypothetical protein